jgi:hypothetical protein
MKNVEKNQTQKLIEAILLLPTFTYKYFENGRKLKEAKAGVDLLDLHTCLNQFRESSSKQSESVCESMV